MEELIGRKIKVIMNSTNGLMIITGELLKIDQPFLVIKTARDKTYVSLYYIKSIELV